MVEQPETPERVLQAKLNALVGDVLGEWKSAPEEDVITFPQEVTYPSGFKLKELKKKTAAGAFWGAYKEGDICLLASTGSFEENTLTRTAQKKPSDDSEGYVVYTVFPSNFFSECQRRGREPKSVVQNALIDSLWKDAQMKAENTKRAKSNVRGTVGILYTKKN